MPVYDITGNEVATGGSSFTDYDRIVKGVAHRGFSSAAPENTLPAYKLARENGFFYVETDISFTSDGVPVCLHDATINRTSNGTGNINDLTWAQVQQYDFGSWFSPAFAGTKIPSFEQFILLCRNIMLHPYVELKNTATYSSAQIQSLVDMANAAGMKGKVTWISFSSTYLNYVKNYDPAARLGFVVSGLTASNITTAQGLKTEENEVFVDTSAVTDAAATLCINGGLPMEVWTIDSAATIRSANPYITGFTSNSLLAGKVLYEASVT
jgi:glycerophosphoryl diester phosphodiesterase